MIIKLVFILIGFSLLFLFPPFLQALSYTGSGLQVHFPSLVEKEILREDGSVIKRFGLAWSAGLQTNILKRFSSFKERPRNPKGALKLLGSCSTLSVLSDSVSMANPSSP